MQVEGYLLETIDVGLVFFKVLSLYVCVLVMMLQFERKTFFSLPSNLRRVMCRIKSNRKNVSVEIWIRGKSKGREQNLKLVAIKWSKSQDGVGSGVYGPRFSERKVMRRLLPGF